MRGFLGQVLIFLAWAVATVLAFVVMIVGRSSLITVLAITYVGDSMQRSWRVRFWGQAYYVIVGLAFLIFLFVVDSYLKDGRAHHDVLRRFLRVTGIELLILFVADLAVTLTQGAAPQPFGIARLPVAGLVGAAFVTYSILVPPKRATPSNTPQGDV